MSLPKGYIRIYTGDGQGKTTAALGLSLRALGHGFTVCLIQFMKGKKYGELYALEKFATFTYHQFGRNEFVSKEKPEQIDIDLAQKGLLFAREILQKGNHDVVILDEITVALWFNLLSLDDVIQVCKDKPNQVELILTGRYAPPELIHLADMVSEILDIKHPYTKGCLGRGGMEW
ncbi:MAG: cob(I)yrinic acid a,c-diamide adenosyltransferase [Candidatus Thermoplasmatota archaeon]